MSGHENTGGIHLSPEQIAQLEAGPGLVIYPAAQELISAQVALSSDQTPYIQRLGNFIGYFSNPESLAGLVANGTKCRQRFSVVYPELTRELEGYYVNTNGRIPKVPDARMITAYEQMRELVDREDPGVCREGQAVDPLFLMR